jgi:hypothetical protein
MAYTTQVHDYTLKVPCWPWNANSFNHFTIRSVTPLDVEAFLKPRGTDCIVVDNGMVEAKEQHTTCSPWDTMLYGYKKIHTSRDSRGVYNSDVHVPCNWDDNHPIVQKIKGIAKQEAENENNYYSRIWV